MQRATPILSLGVSWQRRSKLWLALKVARQCTKNRFTLPGPQSGQSWSGDRRLAQPGACVWEQCESDGGFLCLLGERRCATTRLQVIEPVPLPSIFSFTAHKQNIQHADPWQSSKLTITSSLTEERPNNLSKNPKVEVRFNTTNLNERHGRTDFLLVGVSAHVLFPQTWRQSQVKKGRRRRRTVMMHLSPTVTDWSSWQ